MAKTKRADVTREILLELARIINEKYDCPVAFDRDPLLAIVHETKSARYHIRVDSSRILIYEEKFPKKDPGYRPILVVGLDGKWPEEHSMAFELADPECFEKFKKWLPGKKFKRRKPYSIYDLPQWAIDYISNIISNAGCVLVKCPSCGNVHESGYTCGCGFDCSFEILYPYLKYEDDLPIAGEE